ncbi:unnamed protein product [Coregonus sp. 'balchen']|nr:unnamed protein product [Coregonus sp. 'balchen']
MALRLRLLILQPQCLPLGVPLHKRNPSQRVHLRNLPHLKSQKHLKSHQLQDFSPCLEGLLPSLAQLLLKLQVLCWEGCLQGLVHSQLQLPLKLRVLCWEGCLEGPVPSQLQLPLKLRVLCWEGCLEGLVPNQLQLPRKPLVLCSGVSVDLKPDGKAVEVAQGQGIEKRPASAVDCQSKEAEIPTASEQPAKTEQPSKSEQPPTNDQSSSGKDKAAFVEGEVIHEKPMVIVGKPESKETDKSGPPVESTQKIPQADQLTKTEEPAPKSLFGGFMSGTSDAGKSFGSMFSSPPTIPKALPTMPQAEAGGGLFSGFKTMSAGLFQEEKQEPSTASLFGAKLGGFWGAPVEPPKPQARPVITTQPKANDKPTKDTSDQSSVGPPDLAKPQICISTPEVDPSASLSQKEKESLVEPPPSADPTSEVQLDNQSKKDLLSAKRPVEA